MANLRLVAFLAGAAALGWGVWTRTALGLVVGIALLVGFAVLARHHGDLGRRRRRAATLVEINTEAAARAARDWAALPVRHAARAAPDHPFAADLDLFGRASLAHLLDTPSTPMGESALARWLTEPAAPPTVRERQAAVADLAPRLELRHELELRGRLRDGPRPDPAPFLAWSEGTPWLARRPALRWVAWIGPILFVVLAAAQALGLTPLPFWLLPLAVNVLVSQTAGRLGYARIADAAGQAGALGADAAQLSLLAAAPVTAPLLLRLRDELAVAGSPAAAHLARLSRLLGLSIPASSLAYGVIQALSLWDFHLLAALERWQLRAGGHVRRWLDVLGEAEALAALATLTHDEPDWVFPDLDPSADAFAAADLGHPLLRGGARVGNSVTVGPPGSFLLVTGSNMSGKSTLLRAIGVNAVLVQAGGPVCATACRLPPLAIHTSMHVQDSLAEGVSYFMAELRRLKGVADAARAATGGDRRLLYLLDEILQGTNTAERQIAARGIVRHLVAAGAIGAISTHDLQLADTPAVAALARPIHFAETVSTGGPGPAMTFDYTARPGLATSTNALRLMELVGLDLDLDPAPDP